jgi:hypothetical protein
MSTDDLSTVLGKTLEEARALFPMFTFRVTNEGGSSRLGSAEVRLNRVNVWTDGERITAIRGMG